MVASSLTQARDFWRVRESYSEAQKPLGASVKNDVSVPVAAIPEFIARADAAVERICPGARPLPISHFGDGNIHYNVAQPAGMAKDAFMALWDDIVHAVHEVVLDLGGSISAEHGIGVMKRAELAQVKGDVAMDLMRKHQGGVRPEGHPQSGQGAVIQCWALGVASDQPRDLRCSPGRYCPAACRSTIASGVQILAIPARLG